MIDLEVYVESWWRKIMTTKVMRNRYWIELLSDNFEEEFFWLVWKRCDYDWVLWSIKSFVMDGITTDVGV